MHILGIDPGTTHSGVALLDFQPPSLDPRVRKSVVLAADAAVPNELILESARAADQGYLGALGVLGFQGYAFTPGYPRVAIETMQVIYKRAGIETINTLVFLGCLKERLGGLCKLVTRQQVLRALCGTTRAGDPDVRQALIDRLGEPGTKKNPGPTAGVTDHAWQALGVAFTAGLQAEG